MSWFRRRLMMLMNFARSCYGTGVWIEAKPWIDTDKWKDNK